MYACTLTTLTLFVSAHTYVGASCYHNTMYALRYPSQAKEHGPSFESSTDDALIEDGELSCMARVFMVGYIPKPSQEENGASLCSIIGILSYLMARVL